MTAQHTATPWEIRESASNGNLFIYQNGQKEHVAGVLKLRSEGIETGEANAALIVSAVNNTAGIGINPEAVPDIAKALRDLLFHVEEYMDFGKQGGQEVILQKAARAALLKAKL